MKIHFCGAAGEVTGSRHVVEVNGKKVLLDCGMVQGRRAEAKDKNKSFLFNPEEIEAVILSHAHIDHSGVLPMLWKQGFRGKIYATPATADIVKYMLADSAHIQKMDAKFLFKHKKESVEPIYTQEDVDEVLQLLAVVPYGEKVKVLPEISFVFRDAGHILGSSTVELEIRENNSVTKLGYTGDLGRKNLPIIRDPEYLTDIEYFICESTYGNRLHHPFEDVCERLSNAIIKTIGRGGKIIIPSFALERAQEIVYVLHQLTDEEKIPRIPVYIDSPLTTNLFDVFHRHGECYDDETKKIFSDKHDNPFRFRNLKQTQSVDESKEITASDEPAIIISASGMCESGRILHHLASTISDPKNLILFVGYQAQNTLGRRIVEGERRVRIFGEYYAVNAEVESLKEFSAHADYKDIIEFVRHMKKLKKMFLVHGEEEALNTLKNKLQQENKNLEIVIPKLDDVMEIV